MKTYYISDGIESGDNVEFETDEEARDWFHNAVKDWFEEPLQRISWDKQELREDSQSSTNRPRLVRDEPNSYSETICIAFFDDPKTD